MKEQVCLLKIILVGGYPPPFGGVSAHCQRLMNLLLKNDVRCQIVDCSSELKNNDNVVNIREIRKLLGTFNQTNEIIHIHSAGIDSKKIFGLIILSLLCQIRRIKLITTFHSLSDFALKKSNWLDKLFIKIFLNSTSHYIAVSQRVKDDLASLKFNPKKISVIPAFLPPTVKKQDIDEIPYEVWSFIDEHTPIITANAPHLEFYNDQDLYGTDMCIELCSNLYKTFPRVGFVFCIPNVEDYDYFNRLKTRTIKAGIEKNFLFVTKPYHYYPILSKSDIFVRPTNTDGDAISIREALYFNIPTLASDAVSRPEPTILFNNRDINDFIVKTRNVLSNYEFYKKALTEIKWKDNFREIMDIYKQVTTTKGEISTNEQS